MRGKKVTDRGGGRCRQIEEEEKETGRGGGRCRQIGLITYG
jgi:hypothetical protein